MTAAFGTAGAGQLTATSGAALTPALPASVTAGDLLIAHVFYGGSTTAPDTPADWTLLDGPRSLSTPATNGRVWTYGKVAVGSDAAPAFGTQAVTTPRRGRVYRFTGVLSDTVSNIVGAFNFETGTSAAVSDVGVATGADAFDYLACQLVAIAENPTIGDFTGETGGNWTEAVAEYTGTTGTPDTLLQLQTSVVSPSTTINGGTVTPSTTNPWGVVGFYIRSAPPPTEPPWASGAASAVTTAFTPPDNSLLVAICAIGNGAAVTATGAVTDSLGGSWTLLARGQTGTMGNAEVFCRDISTGQSMTVTYDSTAADMGVKVRALSGFAATASQPGAVATTAAGTTAELALTTTTAGSLPVVALGYQVGAIGPMTPNGSTTEHGDVNGGSGDTYAAGEASSVTGTPGSITLGWSGETGLSDNVMVAVEILPAAQSAAATPGPVVAPRAAVTRAAVW